MSNRKVIISKIINYRPTERKKVEYAKETDQDETQQRHIDWHDINLRAIGYIIGFIVTMILLALIMIKSNTPPMSHESPSPKNFRPTAVTLTAYKLPFRA